MVSFSQRDLTASKANLLAPCCSSLSFLLALHWGVRCFSLLGLPASLSSPLLPRSHYHPTSHYRSASQTSHANTPCLAHPAVSKYRRIRRKGRYPRDTPTPSLATAQESVSSLYGCPSVLSRHPFLGPDPEHYHQPILIFVSASPPIARPPFPPP